MPDRWSREGLIDIVAQKAPDDTIHIIILIHVGKFAFEIDDARHFFQCQWNIRPVVVLLCQSSNTYVDCVVEEVEMWTGDQFDSWEAVGCIDTGGVREAVVEVDQCFELCDYLGGRGGALWGREGC